MTSPRVPIPHDLAAELLIHLAGERGRRLASLTRFDVPEHTDDPLGAGLVAAILKDLARVEDLEARLRAAIEEARA